MTYTEILNLINTNLANYSNIVPSKHREVEIALLNYIKDNLPILKGSVYIGDARDSQEVTVRFPDVGMNNYIVICQLYSNNPSTIENDNNVSLIVYQKTNTSFQVSLYEEAAGVQDLYFDYVMYKP